MNRLQKQGEEEPEEIVSDRDYFVVATPNASWYVSTVMARHIEQALDSAPPREWVAFVDLSGSRIRVLTRQIESIIQCTAEQRARDRAFWRAVRREHRADRDWDEDC